MFDVSDTSITKRHCLCKTCLWSHPVNAEQNEYKCHKWGTVQNVGVCKYYDEYKDNH